MKLTKDALTPEQFYDIYAPIFGFNYDMKELIKKATEENFAIMHDGYIYIIKAA